MPNILYWMCKSYARLHLHSSFARKGLRVSEKYNCAYPTFKEGFQSNVEVVIKFQLSLHSSDSPIYLEVIEHLEDFSLEASRLLGWSSRNIQAARMKFQKQLEFSNITLDKSKKLDAKIQMDTGWLQKNRKIIQVQIEDKQHRYNSR